MAQKTSVSERLGTPAKKFTNRWVQTERKAHEEWANLIARKPRAAMLLHKLIANMGHQNALVVSQKTLARMLGCSVETIKRAVNDLVSERWIQVVRIGKGKESAYVVNDQVAWGEKRSGQRLSVFSATVLADAEDQPLETLEETKLRRIPTLYSGEEQIPSGEDGGDPPSQALIDGTEPDLPTRDPDTYDAFSGRTDNDEWRSSKFKMTHFGTLQICLK